MGKLTSIAFPGGRKPLADGQREAFFHLDPTAQLPAQSALAKPNRTSSTPMAQLHRAISRLGSAFPTLTTGHRPPAAQARLSPSTSDKRWPRVTPALALLLMLPTASAQQAAKKPAEVTPAAKSGAEEIQPSRYAGADPTAYIASLSARFAIRTRATDPFGQLQDPTAKPVQPKVVKSTTNRQVAVAKPFNEIIRQIRVTTVMPAEQKFLVGTRSIKLGDSLPIVANGNRFRVQVVEISSQRIVFRNLDSNETGELPLDVMPAGMSRGARGVMAPGMQTTRPDAPLELDNPSPAAGSKRGF